MKYKYISEFVIGFVLVFSLQVGFCAEKSAPVAAGTSPTSAPTPVTTTASGEAIPAKAQVCVACHGPDGNSTVAMWPKLAGQHPKYLLQQLHAFKEGDKGGRNVPVMNGMVSGLTPTDMADLAAFYAKQKTSPGEAKPNLLALGEQIYRGGNRESGVTACAGCHGPAGQGNAQAGFPKLSGQQADYIVQQLVAYQKAERKTDPNGIMRDIAKRMDPKQMEAVASYASGLY